MAEYEDIDRVVAQADNIMDTAVRVMRENGVEVPDTRYLAIGSEDMVAHDNCTQMTVSLATSRHGLPNPDTPQMMRVNTCNSGFIVDFIIQIVRCTPSMNESGSISTRGESTSVRMQNLVQERTPTVNADSLDAAARVQMRDVFVLHRIANAINDFDDQLGRAMNYSIIVGQDSGAVQAISLIIPVNV